MFHTFCTLLKFLHQLATVGELWWLQMFHLSEETISTQQEKNCTNHEKAAKGSCHESPSRHTYVVVILLTNLRAAPYLYLVRPPCGTLSMCHIYYVLLLR